MDIKNYTFYLSLLIITLLGGCTYDYNLPDLYVDFKFKIDVSQLMDELLEEYGYSAEKEMDIILIYYNKDGEIMDYQISSETRTFTKPKNCAYFEAQITSLPLKVCTIYIKQSLEDFNLWGEPNDPPHIFIYNKQDVEKVIYNVPKRYTFYMEINITSSDRISAVEKAGYQIMSYKTYLYYYNEENEIETFQEIKSTSVNPYTVYDVDKVGVCCECYGRADLWETVLVCRLLSDEVSTEFLQNNTSSQNPYIFDIDHVEYLVPINYTFYLTGFSLQEEMEAVESMGYNIADTKSYLYEGNWDGSRVQFFDGEIYSSNKEKVGLMTECYGFDGGDKILICKIYSEMISSEWLSENSTKSNPYQFVADRIDYVVDNPETPSDPDNPDTPGHDTKYGFYTKGFSDDLIKQILNDYGYDLTSQENYFYTKNSNGDLITLDTFSTEKYYTTYNEIGIYYDCYGKKMTGISISKVCRIFSSLQSSEWLGKNTTFNNPYQFEINEIEYFVEPVN